MIEALTTAIDIGKKLIAAAKAAQDADVKMLVADLQLQLAEVKQQVADLMNENTELRKANSAALEVASEPAPTLKDELYYKQDGSGPYCTTCYDSNRKFIRVSEMAPVFHRTCRYRCGVCKSHFGGLG